MTTILIIAIAALCNITAPYSNAPYKQVKADQQSCQSYFAKCMDELPGETDPNDWLNQCVENRK